MVKRLGIILIITIGFLSSTTANSYYNNRNMPVVNMMLSMMDMMSRIMLGRNNGNFYPYSPAAMGALPMSPVSPYGMGSSGFSPWSGLSGYAPGNAIMSAPSTTANKLTKDSFFSSEVFNEAQDPALNSAQNKTEVFSMQSMNGIWQALSGDIIAIYNSYYFIWTDGNKRHLAGNLMVKGKQMLAYIPANKRYLYFQFYKEDNKFAVQDKAGQVYIFKRIH